MLSSRIAGRVIEIKAIEGDVVEAGQVLVRVESRQPGNPPPIIELKAPMGGLVAQSHVRLGEPVEPDKELLDIADLRELWAVARVPEQSRPIAGTGQRRHIRVPALGERRIKGELLRFGTAADTASGTIDAVFLVPNPDLRLRQGMRAEFDLVSDRRENVLSVPREAVQGGPADRHVYREGISIAQRLCPHTRAHRLHLRWQPRGNPVRHLSWRRGGHHRLLFARLRWRWRLVSIKERSITPTDTITTRMARSRAAAAKVALNQPPPPKTKHAEHDEHATAAAGSPMERSSSCTSTGCCLLLVSLLGR